jgi:hypothetical protein
MGCEGMSATIVKGPVHQTIDALVNQNAATRAAFLAELKNLQPPDVDHTEQYLGILTRLMPQLAQFPVNGSTINLLEYLQDTWYNSQGDPPKTELGKLKQWGPEGLQGFWPARYHPIEPIIRQGLIRALELAIEKDLPLDSYWMADGDRLINAGDRFETLVMCTPQQITRIVMTPPSPPPRNPQNPMNFADIRVIKRGEKADFETLEPPQQSGPVITTKLKLFSL